MDVCTFNQPLIPEIGNGIETVLAIHPQQNPTLHLYAEENRHIVQNNKLYVGTPEQPVYYPDKQKNIIDSHQGNKALNRYSSPIIKFTPSK